MTTKMMTMMSLGLRICKKSSTTIASKSMLFNNTAKIVGVEGNNHIRTLSFWSTPSTSQAATGGGIGSTETPSTTDEKDVITKRDIVLEIAETHEMTYAKSERIVNTILDTIVEGVTDDNVVKLSNFGKFEPVLSPARQGRNPSTGQPLYIPPTRRVKFRPYLSFKKSVNEKIL